MQPFFEGEFVRDRICFLLSFLLFLLQHINESALAALLVYDECGHGQTDERQAPCEAEELPEENDRPPLRFHMALNVRDDPSVRADDWLVCIDLGVEDTAGSLVGPAETRPELGEPFRGDQCPESEYEDRDYGEICWYEQFRFPCSMEGNSRVRCVLACEDRQRTNQIGVV